MSSQGFLQDIERTRQTAGYVYSIPPAVPAPAGQTVTERFQVRSVYTNYFFTGGDPRSLTMGQDEVVHMNEMRSLHVVNALGPSLDYTLKAIIPKVTPSSLVALGSTYPDDPGAVPRFAVPPHRTAARSRQGSSLARSGEPELGRR